MSRSGRDEGGQGRGAGSGESGRPPLRVLVVDDEPLARDCVKIALRDEPDVEVVGECRDGGEAVAAVRRLRPDVVFLDVQMPGVDGFAVVERIGAEEMPAVVFVTAYDTHAIRAFEVHALDYVLKPFENARIAAALGRAREQLRSRRDGELGRRLAGLLRSYGAGQPASAEAATAYASRFTVRENDRIRFIPADSVDWIEAADNYAVLHVGEQSHRLRVALQTLAAELDPKRFFQIHRSAIVNLERVREIQPWFGGDYVAILHNGKQLRVSRTRAPLLLRPLT
jgi:two-component system, LytTR family, response regulator